MNVNNFLKEHYVGIMHSFLYDEEMKITISHKNNEIELKKAPSLLTNYLNSKEKENSDNEKKCLIDDVDSGETLLGNMHFQSPNRLVFRSSQVFVELIKRLLITNKNGGFERYSLHDRFQILSKAQTNWTDEIIEEYSSYWAWHNIIKNPAIKWTAERIIRFKDRIDLKELSASPNIYISYQEFTGYYNASKYYRFANIFDLRILSCNKGFIKNSIGDNDKFLDYFLEQCFGTLLGRHFPMFV
jgi:hypothetical protein